MTPPTEGVRNENVRTRAVHRLILVVALAIAISFNMASAATAQTPLTPHGVIAGQLGFEGGPAPGGFHPTAGVVKFVGPQKVGRVKVPESGSFTVDVMPGIYTLTGCGGTKNRQCGSSQDVIVKAQKTSHVQVVWLLAP
jgi:hypothetical protein